MAATIAQTEPAEFRAGETVLWEKSLADYSAADGWALTYFLVGPNRKLTIPATVDGSGWSVEITAADTATLQAGEYYLEGRVTKDAQAFTVVPLQAIQVLPNFSSDESVQAGFDGRSHARKMFDALKSARLTNAGSGGAAMMSYTIFGERSVTLATPEQWQKDFAFWEDRVNWEKRQDALDRGRNVGIGIRFR